MLPKVGSLTAVPAPAATRIAVAASVKQRAVQVAEEEEDQAVAESAAASDLNGLEVRGRDGDRCSKKPTSTTTLIIIA